MPRKRTRKTKGAARLKLRSGLERNVAAFLEEHGVSFTYEEDKIPYTVPSKARKYVPDFKLENGIYVEAKGKFDAATREKMLLVIKQNPDKDIRLLFMRDNKITKVSPTKYTDWCKKHGIKCAVSDKGKVPLEWINERKK